MFPSAVFALVLHISPSVKCGDKREPSSSFEWPSVATLDEVKSSLRRAALLIVTSCIIFFVITKNYLTKRENGKTGKRQFKRGSQNGHPLNFAVIA